MVAAGPVSYGTGALDAAGAAGTRTTTELLLAAPLAAEVAAACAGAASTAQEATFAMNSVTGVAHRVIVGFAESMPTEWLAACGWRFGISTWRSGPVQLARADLPRAPHLLCARCLPDLRRLALDDLARLGE